MLRMTRSSLPFALALASCAVDDETDSSSAPAAVVAGDPGVDPSLDHDRRRPRVPTLIARAVLPAETYARGPTSGSRVASPTNGIVTPFVEKQPVQGVSALIADGDGWYWAMPDNGYGTLESSADFRLRVYRLAPTWETAGGGAGTVEIRG
jgi:glycerophosphoryl diester phosphodiesterase